MNFKFPVCASAYQWIIVEKLKLPWASDFKQQIYANTNSYFLPFSQTKLIMPSVLFCLFITFLLALIRN